jgi:3-oxoacid CoA-transferase B subunit
MYELLLDKNIIFQSENGCLGMNKIIKRPTKDLIENPMIINAGKQEVDVRSGASFFSSSNSFGMIRSKMIDITVLGAIQVSASGDIANWSIPMKRIFGFGGAMDLACSKRIIVCMKHFARSKPNKWSEGEVRPLFHVNKNDLKIVNACTVPLTAASVVNMIITEYAVFEIVNLPMKEMNDNVHYPQLQSQTKQLVLIEKIDSISMEDLKLITGADFVISNNLKSYQMNQYE